MAYPYNYGSFSNVFYDDDKTDSRMELLNNPDKVLDSAYNAFSAALWFYMTPQPPKPSMHEVTVGHFIPNSVDIARGIKGYFGTTINIINGGDECNKVDNNEAARRATFYGDFLTYFEIADKLSTSENDAKKCEYEQPFVSGGDADQLPRYYLHHWWLPDQC